MATLEEIQTKIDADKTLFEEFMLSSLRDDLVAFYRALGCETTQQEIDAFRRCYEPYTPQAAGPEAYRPFSEAAFFAAQPPYREGEFARQPGDHFTSLKFCSPRDLTTEN